MPKKKLAARRKVKNAPRSRLAAKTKKIAKKNAVKTKRPPLLPTKSSLNGKSFSEPAGEVGFFKLCNYGLRF